MRQQWKFARILILDLSNLSVYSRFFRVPIVTTIACKCLTTPSDLVRLFNSSSPIVLDWVAGEDDGNLIAYRDRWRYPCTFFSFCVCLTSRTTVEVHKCIANAIECQYFQVPTLEPRFNSTLSTFCPHETRLGPSALPIGRSTRGRKR